MKKCIFIYRDFADWKKSLWEAVKHLCKGIVRILFAVFFGLLSIVYHLWQASVKWVGRNPGLTLGIFIVTAILIWMLTFVSMRARAIGAENQRDAIAWKYHDFKESHGYYD